MTPTEYINLRNFIKRYGRCVEARPSRTVWRDYRGNELIEYLDGSTKIRRGNCIYTLKERK